MAENTDVRMQSIKMVFVGDGAVGKTCLIIRCMEGVFPNEYTPTVFDHYVATYKKHDIHIAFWDTAGQEAFDRLRPLSYENTSVFLVCFNVTNRASFNNVTTKWVPEVRRNCGQHIPTVLVGTLIDLRKEDVETHVTKGEGLALAKSENMFSYIECSAKQPVACDRVIEEAIKAARKDIPGDNSCCILL